MTERLYDLHSTSFDFNPGAALPFADIAALAAFDDRQIDDGGIAYTTTVRAPWTKRVVSPAPAGDGITIVPTASGDGAWYRTTLAHLSWTTQTLWYIDPALGDDENDGETDTTALATWAELERRWGSARLSGHYYVQILGDMPITDGIKLDRIKIAVSTEIHIKGTRTVLTTGTLSAVTQINRALGQHTQITIAGFDWAPYVGKAVRITKAGATYGATAWVQADLGAGVARVSSFTQTVDGVPGVTTVYSTTSTVQALANDTVEIVSQTVLGLIPRLDFGQGGNVSGRVSFEDFETVQTTTTVGVGAMGSSIYMLRCHIPFLGCASNVIVTSNACRIGRYNFLTLDGYAEIYGCLVYGNIGAAYNTNGITGDTLFTTGGSMTAYGNGMMIGNVGFVVTANPINTVVSGLVKLTGQLYGTTSNTVGIDLQAGSTLIAMTGYVTPQLVTGGAVNIDLHGATTKVWADLGTYFSAPNGARICPQLA